MVQQVRDDAEDGRFAVAEALVGDRGCEVCLAAPGRSEEHQPAFRCSCEAAGLLERHPEELATAQVRVATVGHEQIEGQAAQRAEV